MIERVADDAFSVDVSASCVPEAGVSRLRIPDFVYLLFAAAAFLGARTAALQRTGYDGVFGLYCGQRDGKIEGK